jgi:MOSC domain-containing protein YiiM
MYEIGPYRFSETDARRTVDQIDEFWLQLATGRDASVIEALRPDGSGDLGAAIGRTWSAIGAAGPALRAAGQMPATATGTVVQLSISDGGVPKLPVPSVRVGFGGVVGDRQAARVHHGRPWQALCLWSTEVIDELRAEGHPLGPGLAGENVTISGLPWPEVRAGVRLRLGTVLAEASQFARPCYKNDQWFRDGDSQRMHHRMGPVSRVYATVLEPGTITVGDAAVLEP